MLLAEGSSLLENENGPSAHKRGRICIPYVDANLVNVDEIMTPMGSATPSKFITHLHTKEQLLKIILE